MFCNVPFVSSGTAWRLLACYEASSATVAHGMSTSHSHLAQPRAVCFTRRCLYSQKIAEHLMLASRLTRGTIVEGIRIFSEGVPMLPKLATWSSLKPQVRWRGLLVNSIPCPLLVTI